MDITVNALPSLMSMLLGIIPLAFIGLGIYVMFLFIKALRIYIKKNS
jgi:hypothetical protein